MKIIDLLNKIANGEEVPRKFKYKDIIFIYDIELREHFDEKEDNSFNYYFDLTDYDILTDEVEILEEKKIPEKLTDILRVDDLIPPVDENMYKIWTQTIKNQNKINEIIDYLKSKGDE